MRRLLRCCGPQEVKGDFVDNLFNPFCYIHPAGDSLRHCPLYSVAVSISTARLAQAMTNVSLEQSLSSIECKWLLGTAHTRESITDIALG
jgi:hypothetical protein